MTDIIVIDNIILRLDKIYALILMYENDYRLYFGPETFIPITKTAFEKIHQSILEYKLEQESQHNLEKENDALKEENENLKQHIALMPGGADYLVHSNSFYDSASKQT